MAAQKETTNDARRWKKYISLPKKSTSDSLTEEASAILYTAEQGALIPRGIPPAVNSKLLLSYR